MEVITARKAGIASNDEDLMRKERIMLYPIDLIQLFFQLFR